MLLRNWLSRHDGTAAFVVAVLIAVTFGHMAGSSKWASNQGPQRHLQTTTLETSVPDTADVRQAVAAERSLYVSGAALLFSGIAAFFAYRTIRIMDRTARTQLWAYVSAKADYIHEFRAGQAVAVRFAMYNHGTTPAGDVLTTSRVAVFPYPLPAEFVFPALPPLSDNPFSIHPGQTFFGTRTTEPEGITDEQVTAVIDGTAQRIYIYGRVEYRDSFSHQQTTKFCYSVVGSRNLAKVAGRDGAVPDHIEISFEPATNHNEAS